MGTKIIHVNRQFIAMNNKDGGDRPVYTVKGLGPRARYARAINILGPSRFVHYAENPLSCGARAWLETESEIELIDEMSWQEAKEEGLTNAA